MTNRPTKTKPKHKHARALEKWNAFSKLPVGSSGQRREDLRGNTRTKIGLLATGYLMKMFFFSEQD